jgi:geranylgeranyl diphosphate/geranylgeranyl-bacteriochlorophyllide a reductase
MTASKMTESRIFDAVVVGGGPAGATAAADLARRGRSVVLLDKAGRIKPCGGAIPPRLISEFEIPDGLLVARITSARMISPADKRVMMPIDGGFVGMVDREVFDEWLRTRAAAVGAERRTGAFVRISRDGDGVATVHYKAGGGEQSVRTRTVIGADGTLSAVARQEVPNAKPVDCVFTYHEIVRSPAAGQADFDSTQCDVWYQGALSPDFYAWIFPHGNTVSIGTGSACKGFALRRSVEALRAATGLDGTETIRREGAPIPLRPLKRWANGRDVVLAGMPPASWPLHRARASITPWRAGVSRPMRSKPIFQPAMPGLWLAPANAS